MARTSSPGVQLDRDRDGRRTTVFSEVRERRARLCREMKWVMSGLSYSPVVSDHVMGWPATSSTEESSSCRISRHLPQ